MAMQDLQFGNKRYSAHLDKIYWVHQYTPGVLGQCQNTLRFALCVLSNLENTRIAQHSQCQTSNILGIAQYSQYFKLENTGYSPVFAVFNLKNTP